MKTAQRTIYITEDGTEFLSEHEARDYEIRDSFFRWFKEQNFTLVASESDAIAADLWNRRNELRDLLHRGPAIHITPKEYAWLMHKLGPDKKHAKLARPIHGAHVLSQIKQYYKEAVEEE